MPNTVVVGAQWGDEAKGKVVDYLAQQADVVVRYGGGANAGHTVSAGNEVYKLHLVPSGILHEHVTCVIADGVVVDPRLLAEEIQGLRHRGLPLNNLRISSRAHLIMPYHIVLDQLEETKRGASAIGTTARGIGPAYADKASRVGIRMQDLIDDRRRDRILSAAVDAKNEVLTRLYGADALDTGTVIKEYSAYANVLREYVCDTAPIVAAAAANDRGVVFEGAQGTLLDLNIGTYPYVTSSHPIAGGACLGTGIGPRAIDRVIGVAKCYTTRVGAGVFPTELLNPTGDHIRERGQEYGTTTGRPRRCGWLDAVVLRYAVMHNSLDALALGHLDVLSGLSTVNVAIGYNVGNRYVETLPSDLNSGETVEPVYEELSGWSEEITGVTRYDDLPSTCRVFVNRIQELSGVPIWSVSVGPGREQMIQRTDGS